MHGCCLAAVGDLEGMAMKSWCMMLAYSMCENGSTFLDLFVARLRRHPNVLLDKPGVDCWVLHGKVKVIGSCDVLG